MPRKPPSVPLRGIVRISNAIVVRPTVESLHVKSRIEEAFERHAQIDATGIRVETKGTTITLRGKVSSCLERKEAESVAWATPGVTDVQNCLVVYG